MDDQPKTLSVTEAGKRYFGISKQRQDRRPIGNHPARPEQVRPVRGASP